MRQDDTPHHLVCRDALPFPNGTATNTDEEDDIEEGDPGLDVDGLPLMWSTLR